MDFKKYRKFLLLFIFLNTTPSYAANNNTSLISTLKDGHVVFQVGYYRPSQGKNQHIDIQDLIGDTFTVSNHNDGNAFLGLGYFIDGKSWNIAKMSYGINAFYLAPTSVSGDVIQEDLFDNLSYSYSIRHIPLYAIVKTEFNLKSPKYLLTLDAGVGPNFMTVYGFQEQSLDGGITIPEKPFSANTQTNLSATVGVGFKIDHALGQLSAECGYRFFNLGEGHFVTNNNQVLNHLNTGHVYVNAIQCALSN